MIPAQSAGATLPIHDHVHHGQPTARRHSEGDRRTKLSAFWALLILATIIASSGVIADSTAAVIGAMIVAPLMTPILGTAWPTSTST